MNHLMRIYECLLIYYYVCKYVYVCVCVCLNYAILVLNNAKQVHLNGNYTQTRRLQAALSTTTTNNNNYYYN